MGNIGSGHYQTSRDKRINKIIAQKNEKNSQSQILLQKSNQRNKHCSSTFFMILVNILKIDKGETQTNITKLMMIHKALHPRNDSDRLYLQKKEKRKRTR